MDKPTIGICCDCWTSGNPGIGGGRVMNLATKHVIKDRNFGQEIHTNNFYELVAIMDACCVAKKAHLTEIWTDSRVALTWIEKSKGSTYVNKEHNLAFAAMKPKKGPTKTFNKYKDERPEDLDKIEEALNYIHESGIEIKKWDTEKWGEIPADYGRKSA